MNREDIFERFQKETADHQMIVAHDDGLYRHLKFWTPKSSKNFEIVTAPGTLVVWTDWESYAFGRRVDMFNLFRNPVGQIYPDYWSAKLASSGRHVQRIETEDQFRKHILGEIREWSCDDYDPKFLRVCHAIVWGIAQYDAHRDAGQASA